MLIMSIDHKRFKSVSYDDEYFVVKFKGTAREANVFRQLLLTKIPTIAIDSVNIRCNTTTQSDEFLIERLSLIPILEDAYNFKDSEVIHMSIDQTGGVLNSENIKTDYKIMPNIIIVHMNENQRFIADITCKKGVGKKHIRWSAVANVCFRKIKEDLFEIKARSIGIYTPQRLLEIALDIYDQE